MDATSSADLVSKVRVVVRVRPFLSREIAARNGNSTSCVSVVERASGSSSEEVTVHLRDQSTSRNECYKLDSFFGDEDNNVREIFDSEVRPLIPSIFRGCNATVFAYGATGSGKTYTMQGTDELPGLMPLAMSIILSMCETTGSTVEVSYYEVYMERCYDLLKEEPTEIAILDDKHGQVHLRGLSRVPVQMMSEFNQVFFQGIQKRKVAHTGQNDVSSRSHGALVIVVTTPCGDGSGITITGKLNLIDLAGNEDNRRTCNEGIRIQESAKINQSLFALSNVIYALNNNKPRIPYRESKLTRILQDSLGGTSHALMVACLNPGEYQESVHTVSLAARSRHVSNFISSAKKQETPKLKVDMEAKLREWLESRGKTKSASRVGVFKTPISVKQNAGCHTSVKTKANSKQDYSSRRRSIPVSSRNLFDNAGSDNLATEVTPDCNSSRNITNENRHTKAEVALDAVTLVSRIDTQGDPLEMDGHLRAKSSLDFTESSPIRDWASQKQSPLQKVLSPLDANIERKALEEVSKLCLPSLDPETPETSLENSTSKFQNINTPLEKFNECSSNLKTSLVKEYVDLLNVASREELLKLKGIGPKRAECILQLRECSPLKALDDLEKIGLSSKQVHNLFGRVTRDVFE